MLLSQITITMEWKCVRIHTDIDVLALIYFYDILSSTVVGYQTTTSVGYNWGERSWMNYWVKYYDSYTAQRRTVGVTYNYERLPTYSTITISGKFYNLNNIRYIFPAVSIDIPKFFNLSTPYFSGSNVIPRNLKINLITRHKTLSIKPWINYELIVERFVFELRVGHNQTK